VRIGFLGLEIKRAAPMSPVDSRGGWMRLIREPFTGAWQRNQEWTTDTVLAHHAVYACVTRIAQDIGKLRPKLVEQSRDGIWTETMSPAFSPVLQRPNRFQNHIQFKEWWATSKLINGNAYGLLQRDARGVVTAIYLLDPTRVTVLVTQDGQVFYQLSDDNLSGVKAGAPAVPASEIIHDRMNCLFHPLVGVSPIFACGMAANMGLNIERNSAAFFGNGSNPSGILSAAVAITPQKARELTELWNSQYGGENSGNVAVLGDGMKFEAMRMTAVDSQLIEQLHWTAETVCSCFHVPAFKVGVGSQPTYANAEIANQVYYSDCLQSHIEAWELCMDEGLGLTARKEGGKLLGVELDLDGLLRMDQASQVKTLTDGIKGSLFAPNDARRKIDLKPLKGGDTVYMQQQNYSLEALDARDRENPLAPSTKRPPAPPPPPAQDPAPAEDDPARSARLARRVARGARTLRVRMMA
jgi:HK97 family phage portal protein